MPSTWCFFQWEEDLTEVGDVLALMTMGEVHLYGEFEREKVNFSDLKIISRDQISFLSDLMDFLGIQTDFYGIR